MLLNQQKLNINELNNYLNKIYKKQNINIAQTTYIKAKYLLSKDNKISKENIEKLVMSNLYTEGLRDLMYAFIEDDKNKKIGLFERAIKNLKHIKYYQIDGIYFYAKYLKEIGNTKEYETQFEIGLNGSKKSHFRFLIHQFENLKNNINKPMHEKVMS